jgi:hypothetical protein
MEAGYLGLDVVVCFSLIVRYRVAVELGVRVVRGPFCQPSGGEKHVEDSRDLLGGIRGKY